MKKIFYSILIIVCELLGNQMLYCKSLKPILVFKHFPDNYAYKYIYETKFSPDGNYLLISGLDRISLWDINKGISVDEYKIPHVFCIKFSNDGNTIIAGAEWGVVYYIDRTTREIKKSFKAHDDVKVGSYDWWGAVYSLDISSDENWLITNGLDSKVKIWDYKSGNHIITIQDGISASHIVKFIPYHQQFLIGSSIWNLAFFTKTMEIKNLKNDYFFDIDEYIVFSSDGHYLFGTMTAGNKIGMWDTEAYELKYVFEVNDQYPIPYLDLSLNNELLISSSVTDTISRINCWNIKTKSKIFNMDVIIDKSIHNGGFYNVRFSPDGTKFITGGPDATVLLWDLNEVINSQSSVDYFENYDE